MTAQSICIKIISHKKNVWEENDCVISSLFIHVRFDDWMGTRGFYPALCILNLVAWIYIDHVVRLQCCLLYDIHPVFSISIYQQGHDYQERWDGGYETNVLCIWFQYCVNKRFCRSFIGLSEIKVLLQIQQECNYWYFTTECSFCKFYIYNDPTKNWITWLQKHIQTKKDKIKKWGIFHGKYCMWL